MRYDPDMDLLDRLLRLIKMDRASRSIRRFYRDYDNRMRYPELTRDILDSIGELEFDAAVVDYVGLKIDMDYTHALEIVSQMSPGIQAVYTTWWVRAEMDNGGIHQYFYNKGVDWAFKALEGYRLLGAPKHAALMAQAIDLYLQEEDQQRAHFSGNLLTMLEDYVEARKASNLKDLDALFDRIEGESIIELAFQYMKNHPEEFIAR
jgi:hypothetical protein